MLRFQGRNVVFSEGRLINPKKNTIVFFSSGPRPHPETLAEFEKRAEVAWRLADVEIVNEKSRAKVGKDSAVVHILLKARTKQKFEDKLEEWLPSQGYRLKELGETAIFDAVGWESPEDRDFYESLSEKVLAGKGPQLGHFFYYDTSDPDDEE